VHVPWTNLRQALLLALEEPIEPCAGASYILQIEQFAAVVRQHELLPETHNE
jgi:hypothetical protein